MFSEEDYQKIDSQCFDILVLSPDLIGLRSIKTGDYWELRPDDTNQKILTVHKHRVNKPYHFQRASYSLDKALYDIQTHDDWYFVEKQNGEGQLKPFYGKTIHYESSSLALNNRHDLNMKYKNKEKPLRKKTERRKKDFYKDDSFCYGR